MFGEGLKEDDGEEKKKMKKSWDFLLWRDFWIMNLFWAKEKEYGRLWLRRGKLGER